jgi:hypothetical protein
MDSQQIEKLLSFEEGANLDFKSAIDLDSKRGKVDFLVEVLGLANARSKPAFLVVGVEDKTRKIFGLPANITEERVQQVLAEHCRPPIHCAFEVHPYKRKRVGVLTIWGTNRPYALKTEMGYQDESGKQHRISDKQIFVRRGSTGDIATPDEVVEMALEQQEAPEDMGRIVDVVDDVSSELHYIKDGLDKQMRRHSRERSVEYLFLGILSGLAIGILQTLGLNWNVATVGIILICFWLSILASVLRLIRFGLWRSIIITATVSAIFIGLSALDSFVFEATLLRELWGPASLLLPVWGGIKGMVGGLVAAHFAREEYDFD